MTKRLAPFGVVLAVACAVIAASTPSSAEKMRTEPVMRGALWWLTGVYAEGPEEKLEAAIQAQADVGFTLLWLCNTSPLLQRALEAAESGQNWDRLETIYRIASEKDMGVIADLPQGGWYGQASREKIEAKVLPHIQAYAERYGQHDSFYGWYLNYEINPIQPSANGESAFWRGLWRTLVEACHEAVPGSKVTISPFFLLDTKGHRGFEYLAPEVWAEWWRKTLKETGIDVMMLQDSGEHMAFYSNKEREPFFAAMAEACRDAGTAFWVNVETGELDHADWDEYLSRPAPDAGPWRFTPMEDLESKLRLAARYGEKIVNWGYFPFMDPAAPPGAGEPFFSDGELNPEANYEAYQTYYERFVEAGADKAGE